MPNFSSLEPVILVASRAVDHIPARNGQPARELPGGPAFHIGRALDRLGRPYQLVTGPPAQVEVIPGPAGEEYIIPALPPIQLPESLAGPAVILSPIMREIDPLTVPEVKGLLVVDLQGFVRQPLVPSRSGPPVDLVTLFSRTDIVKASADELGRLTPASLDALSDAILITTRGRNGAVVRCGSDEERIVAEPVESEQTIGAGDAYLAAFTDAVLKGKSPFDAGRAAARFTEAMLRERMVLP